MLDDSEVKKKLDGKEVHWYFGRDYDRWRLVVTKQKVKWLRELWEVSLWDRLCGRDIPHCDRCKETLFEFPRFILNYPLCDFCYGEYSADALNEIPDGYDHNEEEDCE
jgi:hypothetical protein